MDVVGGNKGAAMFAVPLLPIVPLLHWFAMFADIPLRRIEVAPPRKEKLNNVGIAYFNIATKKLLQHYLKM